MASVHLARQVGDAGFARTVAVKRLHPHIARDPDFVAMFLDEARLVARIRHPNVVPTLDVVSFDDELFLVMEYVQGLSLNQLLKVAMASGPMPVAVAVAIVSNALHGLHAAHEATSETGAPLHLVHRDVSPHNLLVGVDGVARIVDFGIAKAMGRLHTTRDGTVRGKTGYMAPEQLAAKKVDARTDVYASAVVLWEALTNQHLFVSESPEATAVNVFELQVPAPSASNGDVPPALDAIVLRGLSRNPDDRFASAREMAIALEEAVLPATSRAVGSIVETLGGENLRRRAVMIAALERDPLEMSSSGASPSVSAAPFSDGGPVRQNVRRRGPIVVLAAVMGSVLLLLGTLASSRASRPSVEAVHAAESSAPDPSASVPVATVTATAEPHLFVEASSLRTPAHGPKPGVRPRPSARPAVPVKSSCTPPYTVDHQGYRVPKRECL